MLTYQGLSDTSSWAPFLQFVAERVARWKVKNWTATMEANAEGCVHTHLLLQFMSTQDRGINEFIFLFPAADQIMWPWLKAGPGGKEKWWHASSRLKFPICCQRGVCQPRAG